MCVCVCVCNHNTSAGFELLRQNFADLVHPRRFNLRRRSLHETNNDTALRFLLRLGLVKVLVGLCCTCTMKTSSLELHQISNFLLSPLAFSVMPTALI